MILFKSYRINLLPTSYYQLNSHKIEVLATEQIVTEILNFCSIKDDCYLLQGPVRQSVKGQSHVIWSTTVRITSIAMHGMGQCVTVR